jgi:hypothetical protein
VIRIVGGLLAAAALGTAIWAGQSAPACHPDLARQRDRGAAVEVGHCVAAGIRTMVADRH